MKFVLNLNPKRLLFLMFGIPLISGVVAGLFSRIINSNWLIFLINILPIVLLYTVFSSWFWIIGIALNQRVHSEIRMKTIVFNLSMFYILIMESMIIVQTITGSFVIHIAFLFWGTICILYVIYFVIKNLVMAEKQDKVRFNDYIALCLSFLILPLGIFLIQQRANKLYRKESL